MAHYLINSGFGVKQSLHAFQRIHFQPGYSARHGLLGSPYRATGLSALKRGPVLLEWPGQRIMRPPRGADDARYARCDCGVVGGWSGRTFMAIDAGSR